METLSPLAAPRFLCRGVLTQLMGTNAANHTGKDTYTASVQEIRSGLMLGLEILFINGLSTNTEVGCPLRADWKNWS